MKLICVLLLLLLPAGGIAQGQQAGRKPSAGKTAGAESKVRFDSGTSALKIAFELFSNLILVQARVNGSEPLTFILDTGAETSVLDARQAKALGLKPGGKTVSAGVAGDAEATFSKGVNVTLTGVRVLDRTIYVLPLESLSAVGRRIDGILGNDILKDFVVEIDYAAKTLDLHEPLGYRHSGPGESVALLMEGGLPFVRARVWTEGRRAPLEAKLEIDSGSTGAVLFNTPFVKRHRLLAALPKSAQIRIGGVGGSAKAFIGRVRSMALGKFLIDRPIARFSQAARGDYASAKYDGLLGGEVLRRFKVTFDYSRLLMTLEPNLYFAEPYETDMSGLRLLADGDELLVDDVVEKSPAAEAGARGGDVLLAIDGRSAREFTLDEVRALFTRDGKEYLLSLSRDGKTLQIKIKLKRLL